MMVIFFIAAELAELLRFRVDGVFGRWFEAEFELHCVLGSGLRRFIVREV
jgi:hypothetical protein